MLSDDDIRALMHERADQVEPGRPDSGIVTAARRRRRLRHAALGTAGLVAAGVAAGLVVLAGSDSSRTARVEPAVTQGPTPDPSTPQSPSATVSTTAASTTVPIPRTPTQTTLSVLPPVDSAIGLYADCQHVSVEPSEIRLSCGDGGMGLEQLHWLSWTASGARAVGTPYYNDCSPNCATGHFHYVSNTTVVLSQPERDVDGRLVWSMIDFHPQPPGYATGPLGGGPESMPTRPV